MSIRVKFFASLRERLDLEEAEFAVDQAATVAEAWRLATENAEMPANVLAAVNQEYADAEQPLADGDEVAFFPPVTGG